MKRGRAISIGVKSLLMLFIVSLYNNCGEFNTYSSVSQSSSKSDSLGTVVGDKFQLSSPGQLEQKLGETVEYPVSVKSENGFSGTVYLSVNRESLDAVVGGVDIVTKLSQQEVYLTADDTSKYVSLTVTTTEASPSFSNVNLVVEATTDQASAASGVTKSSYLDVKPIYELKMPGGPVGQRWERAETLNFRSHKGGLTLRFINYDTKDTHIVHGSRAIPHQNVGQALAKAPAEGQAGGVYEVKIAENETRDALYWYHDIETSKDSRTMNFGVSDPRAMKLSARVPTSADKNKEGEAASAGSKKPKTHSCHDPVGVD